jgi:hypothetical protein
MDFMDRELINQGRALSRKQLQRPVVLGKKEADGHVKPPVIPEDLD